MSNKKAVSNRYLTIDTQDLLSKALPNVNYQLRRIGNQNTVSTQEKIEVKFPTYGYTDPTNSLIVPMVVVQNSYHGECSLQVFTGFYRQVCSNGMMAAVTETTIGRIVHLKTYQEQVKQLEYRIAAFLENTIVQKNELNRITALDLDLTRSMKIVTGLGFSEGLTKKIRQAILVPVRESDTSTNLYTLWNIVNETMRKNSRSESAQIDKNINLFEKLETLYKVA